MSFRYHGIGIPISICHLTPQECEDWKSCANNGGADSPDKHKDIICSVCKSKHFQEGNLLNISFLL